MGKVPSRKLQVHCVLVCANPATMSPNDPRISETTLSLPVITRQENPGDGHRREGSANIIVEFPNMVPTRRVVPETAFIDWTLKKAVNRSHSVP